METPRSDIWLSHEGPIPAELLSEFQRLVDSSGLSFRMEQRPSTRVFAGVTWLLPTAVMVFIAKSYFDGFLAEVGKDHYQALKTGLRFLGDRLSRVKVSLAGAAGKVAASQRYSLIYSLWCEREPQGQFKFLLPADVPAEDVDTAIGVFLTFLEAYYGGTLGAADFDTLAAARPIGGTVLLAYDPKSGGIDVVDPMDGMA